MAKTEVPDNKTLREAKRAPYAMSFPALALLFVFFMVPLITLLRIALSDKPDPFLPNYDFGWKWGNFGTAFDDYGEELVRAITYSGIATILCLLIAYPLAYFIVFKGGRFRNLLLGLVMIPFFTSFLLRTIAWESLFADQGPIMDFLRTFSLVSPLESLGIVTDGRILRTRTAVVGGLTYNFLPFALLPIYVSLEKVDPKLVEAAGDLYSNFAGAFRKVILPLSLPGVFAGTLLTFIPAMGDFINAERLGNQNTAVIGSAVQSQFLEQSDYPTAAAMSFVLMAIITLGVLIYARFLGTEELV
jgi:spermidine/putrescine transport system permease protein